MFRDLGPWDALNFLNIYHAEVATFIFPMKMLDPGYELPPDSIRQFLEEEVMVRRGLRVDRSGGRAARRAVSLTYACS